MNEAEIKAGNIYMEKTKKTNTNSQQYQYLTQSEKESDPKYGLYISIIMILFLSIILFCLFAYTMLRIDTDANILGHWVTVLIFLVTISATISPLIVYERQSKFEREIKNTIIKKHKIMKKDINDISQTINSKLQEYNNLNMEKFQEIEKFNLAVRQELLNFHIGTTRQALFAINTSKDNRFLDDYFLNMIECLKFVIGQYPLDTRKKILNALCKAFCLDMDFLKKTHPQYIKFLSDL